MPWMLGFLLFYELCTLNVAFCPLRSLRRSSWGSAAISLHASEQAPSMEARHVSH